MFANGCVLLLALMTKRTRCSLANCRRGEPDRATERDRERERVERREGERARASAAAADVGDNDDMITLIMCE